MLRQTARPPARAAEAERWGAPHVASCRPRRPIDPVLPWIAPFSGAARALSQGRPDRGEEIPSSRGPTLLDETDAEGKQAQGSSRRARLPANHPRWPMSVSLDSTCPVGPLLPLIENASLPANWVDSFYHEVLLTFDQTVHFSHRTIHRTVVTIVRRRARPWCPRPSAPCSSAPPPSSSSLADASSSPSSS